MSGSIHNMATTRKVNIQPVRVSPSTLTPAGTRAQALKAEGKPSRTVVKRSITLSRHNVEDIEAIVGRGKVSAFVDRAVTRELERVRFDALLAEITERHGPITPDDRAAARKALERVGIVLADSE